MFLNIRQLNLSGLEHVLKYLNSQVDPSALAECGVPVCRVVQEPGQFVLVFPGAFTASLCTGYLIAESVFFARHHYLDRAEQVRVHTF
jgi:protein Jumonji